jgi:hypothetical protein
VRIGQSENPSFCYRKNTGDRAGKEVVQLLLSDGFAGITPTLKGLKQFAKYHCNRAKTGAGCSNWGKKIFLLLALTAGASSSPGVFDGRVRGLQRNFDWK